MATRERLIPGQCQRPKPWNEKAVQKIIDTAGYVLVQTKYDGLRAHILHLHGGKLTVVTREGIEIEAITLNDSIMRKLRMALWKFPDNIALDCEVVIRGEEFNAMSGHLRRRAALPHDLAERVAFYVFDCVPSSRIRGEVSFHGWNRSLQYRNEQLAGISHEGPLYRAVTCPLSTVQDIMRMYEDVRQHGYEGLVVKDPGELYQNGKRGSWFKVKNECSEDGRIVGYVPGTKGNLGLNVGFVVELESGVRVNVTGINRELMLALTSNEEKYLGRYVEVEYMDKTPDGSLRHPRFKCFRDMEGAEGIKA